MQLRPYSSYHDASIICKWSNEERTHMLWCANRFSFPLSQNNFDEVLFENEREWKDCAFVATDESGEVVGFFCYSLNQENKVGFLKFVQISPEHRGLGYGKQMIDLALKYAKDISGAESVQLNVFDVNTTAFQCYQKCGFIEHTRTPEAFTYKNEKWGRIHMLCEFNCDK